jgi:hypothetical protein
MRRDVLLVLAILLPGLLWSSRGSALSVRIQEILGRIDPQRIRADVEDLAALETRFALDPRFAQATDLVREKLRGAGLTVELDPFQVGGEAEVSNVVARLRSASERPAILIAAHYDSIAFPAGSGAPGSEDNASGVAALLEIARVLAAEPVATDLHLVAFAAEEVGLWGSRHMAESNPSVQAVINMDMVGYNPRGRNEILLDGYPTSRGLLARLADAAQRYSPELRVSAGLFSQGKSDHRPFAELGIPSLTVAGAWHQQYPHYHTAKDTPRHVDPFLVARVARAVTARVLLMAGLADGAPVARAGPFIDAEVGEDARLSADRSFDPRATGPLSYSWVQLDGPPVDPAIQGDQISFAAREPGAYRFALSVTAPDGRTSEPELGAVVVEEGGGCSLGMTSTRLDSWLLWGLLAALGQVWLRRLAPRSRSR